jgi:hypothetical protein
MPREVFVMSNGDSVLAWDLKFSAVARHQEKLPLLIQEPGGKFRRGTLRCTVESADVSFCAYKDSVEVGQEGQLSTERDEFFEVAIVALHPSKNEVRVSGRATRKIAFEREP